MATPRQFTDYYAVLEVDKKASHEAIKQAYRRLARQLHPDLNPGDETAAEQFKVLNEAYQVLSDEAKRRQYDRYGLDWKHLQQGCTATENPGRRNDDFEEMEFGRSGSFEDLLGDILRRYS